MKLAVLSLGLLAAAATTRAGEESIKVKDLPKPVLAAVKAKFPEAKVTGAAKEEEDGKTVFEVTIEDDETKIDLAVSPKGKILEVEKTIEPGKLPKAVAAAIKAEHPRAKIKKAESIVKYEGEDEDDDEKDDKDDEEDEDDEEKYFEVVLSFKGNYSLEVKVSAKGKILPLEDDDDEDEEDDEEDDKDEK